MLQTIKNEEAHGKSQKKKKTSGKTNGCVWIGWPPAKEVFSSLFAVSSKRRTKSSASTSKKKGFVPLPEKIRRVGYTRTHGPKMASEKKKEINSRSPHHHPLNTPAPFEFSSGLQSQPPFFFFRNSHNNKLTEHTRTLIKLVDSWGKKTNASLAWG